MTATAVRPTGLIPAPRAAADDATTQVARPEPAACRAVAYQRVLHQLVRRELRLLADLATWAPPGEDQRTAALTRHADLVSRVLLHHHAVEREAVWPALLRAAPAPARDAVEDWTARCARIDHMLRDLSTAARQWQVAGTDPARSAFASACRALAMPSTPRPARRSARCSRSSPSTSPRRTGPPSPPRRTAGCPAPSSCSCSAWRSRTPARATAPACSVVCRGRRGRRGGCTAPAATAPRSCASAGPRPHPEPAVTPSR